MKINEFISELVKIIAESASNAELINDCQKLINLALKFSEISNDIIIDKIDDDFINFSIKRP